MQLLSIYDLWKVSLNLPSNNLSSGVAYCDLKWKKKNDLFTFFYCIDVVFRKRDSISVKEEARVDLAV
jgi:hypothetical protein